MLSMEVDGKVIYIHIFKAILHPTEEVSLHALDTMDDLVADAQPLCTGDVLARIIYDATFRNKELLVMN